MRKSSTQESRKEGNKGISRKASGHSPSDTEYLIPNTCLGSHLPISLSPGLSLPTAEGAARVTMCILKNEHAYSGIFAICQQWHFEIIVVDTGSTDSTVKIAESSALGVPLPMVR